MSAFAGTGLLSNGDYGVLESFLGGIRIVIKELKATAPIQIPLHGDLIWKNFIFHDTAVCAIDFDDCTYGFPLYDLAPLLLGYLDEQHYTTLKQAAWAGYTSVLPLPDSHQQLLESLIAARFALSIHWIAANRNNPALQNRAPEIIASRIKRLKAYLDTGKLERGEIII
jgi:Ser/Thr protein kinase RdoA (MazF antagonist)